MSNLTVAHSGECALATYPTLSCITGRASFAYHEVAARRFENSGERAHIKRGHNDTRLADRRSPS